MADDPIVRLHERLDNLATSMMQINVNIAEMRGESTQAKRDVEWMREQFHLRDTRATVLREWGEGELKRVDDRITTHILGIERDKAYMKGMWRVVTFIGLLLAGTMSYLWSGLGTLFDRIQSVETVVLPRVKDAEQQLRLLDTRLENHIAENTRSRDPVIAPREGSK